VDTANPLLLFALADAKDATTRRAPRDATVVLLPDRRVVVASAALRVTADMCVLQSNDKEEEGRGSFGRSVVPRERTSARDVV
jgi:hypothetical protein